MAAALMPVSARAVLRSLRLPFLVLPPTSVLLGYATAAGTGSEIALRDLLLALGGALCAHMSVNLLNEYADFRSGLDAMTTRTPFSGGSGALVETPRAAGLALAAGAATLGATVLTGLYFALRRGPGILPLGAAGVLIVLAYTPWLNRQPWLCLLAPGLAFGPLMVVGTHFALTGEYSGHALGVSLVPFFLTSNLLLLNQYPDVTADRRVGRRTFPVVYGLERSTMIYGLFAGAAALAILAGVGLAAWPASALAALLPLAAALVAWLGARRHAAEPTRLLRSLALNVMAAVLTPLVLGIALLGGASTA